MLVFDLGMHEGYDTDHYLRRGFTVVAVEANPHLCKFAHERFELPIARGDLTIVNAAISDRSGVTSFYISKDNLKSSLVWTPNDKIETVPVRGICMEYLIKLFGVPDFLKCDIEGADVYVLEQLRDGGWKPKYLSVEDCRYGFDYFKLMHECGYTGFKLSDQSKVIPGTSGPLGDELPGEWFSYEGMMIYYLAKVRDRNGVRVAPRLDQDGKEVWWDIHCTCEE